MILITPLLLLIAAAFTQIVYGLHNPDIDTVSPVALALLLGAVASLAFTVYTAL